MIQYHIFTDLSCFTTRLFQGYRLCVLPALFIGLAAGLSTGVAHAELIIQDNAQTPVKVVTANSTGPDSINRQNIATAQANEQLPSDTSIIKLMQVMHIDQQIQSIIDGQKQAIAAIHQQSDKINSPSTDSDQELSRRQQQLQTQIQQILGQYAKVMVGGIENVTDKETLTRAYIQAAKTYYTQAEVDAQIAFYDTPIGQSILDKQPQVTAAFLQQSLPKDMSETQQQLGELLPQVEQIIKGIF